MARMIMISGLVLPMLLWSGLVLAAPASVHEVLPPAWLERDGQRQPLTPETRLQPGDTVASGAGGGAQMQRADGSSLHVGEHSRFEINHSEEEDAVLYVRLMEGRMRYAGPVGGMTRPMYLDIGRLRAELDSGEVLAVAEDGVGDMLLVAGEFLLSSRGLEPQRFSKPGTWYRLNNGGLNSGQLDLDSVRYQSEEMKLDDSRGVLTRDGGWIANLSSMRDAQAAREMAEALKREGYPVRIQQHRDQRGVWHRVQIPHYRSEADARAVEARLSGRHGITGVWVFAQ